MHVSYITRVYHSGSKRVGINVDFAVRVDCMYVPMTLLTYARDTG